MGNQETEETQCEGRFHKVSSEKGVGSKEKEMCSNWKYKTE